MHGQRNKFVDAGLAMKLCSWTIVLEKCQHSPGFDFYQPALVMGLRDLFINLYILI